MITKQATEPAYWSAHLRQTVRFADGLQELLKKNKERCIDCQK